MVRGLAVQHAVNRCRREPLLHPAVVHQIGLADPVQVRQPGAMPHHLADGDLRLAVGAELRPVFVHRRFIVDQRAVDEPVNDRRGQALGRGEDHRAGVGGPVRRAAAVGPTGPDIDNGLTVQVDRTTRRRRSGDREKAGRRPAPHRRSAGRPPLEHRVGALRCGPRSSACFTMHLMLPGTPANKPIVTDSLMHRTLAVSGGRWAAARGPERHPSESGFPAASRICCAASVGVSSPSRTWRSTLRATLRTADC